MSFAGHKTIAMLAALLAAALLPGCAGNGNGLDSNGNPIGSGGGTEPLTADFQSIQDNVFTPICTKCHIGAGAPQGLQLDATHSYALLVGVPSNEKPGVLRVKASDPDNSYIVQKLQGSSGIVGERMPFGGPYLPQSTIDVIRQWIANGAPQAAAAGMSLEAAVKAVQHFAVAATSPDNGANVSLGLPRIVVNFNGDIDSNLLNNTTVTVVKADGQPIAITTTLPAGNPSAILITPQSPLTTGTYSVTLQGSLANMDAQALGSDYSFTFTVDDLQ